MATQTAFRWPKRSREAVALFAAGGTWQSITAALGIGDRTLERWHVRPEFRAAIEAERIIIAAALTAEGIANKQNRLAEQNERWQRLQAIRAERATAYAGLTPGGGTGLLARTVKLSATGTEVIEYVLDKAYLDAIRSLEEQAAKELGQWSETVTVRTDWVERVKVRAAEMGLSDEDATAAIAAAEALVSKGRRWP